MNWKALIKLQSGLLVIMGLMLLAPGIHATLSNAKVDRVFYLLSSCSIFIGFSVFSIIKIKIDELNHRMGFIVVSSSWFVACLIGALPYYVTGSVLTFTDCFFESASGFTGTGASILTNIEALDRSILLWRSLTQWLGGMGIIVFFIAILPMLGVGGQQLFQAETTGPSKDKMTPKIRDTAKNLWRLYVGFTLLLTALLITAGLSSFDAFNHALTTMSTGGFSTKNTGVGHFNSAVVDYILILFMLIGSINFGLHYRFLLKRDWRIFKDTELKAYCLIIFLACFVLFISNFGFTLSGFEKNVRSVLFIAVDTISSTGYTYLDYQDWSVLSHYILILLMVMGGMSGSTAGGTKCIRLVAAFKLLLKELKQVIHPSAVLGIKINNRTARDRIANAIWGFIFLYILSLSLITGVLTANGLDLLSATSASISALSNIGPALGELGPLDNYQALNNSSKYALCFGMLLGRLEFMAILVLFFPDYWKK